MCIDKRYTFTNCRCIETDHHYCLENLNTNAITSKCKYYRGIEDNVREGMCNNHDMHSPEEEEVEEMKEKRKKRGCSSACCSVQ